MSVLKALKKLDYSDLKEKFYCLFLRDVSQ